VARIRRRATSLALIAFYLPTRYLAAGCPNSMGSAARIPPLKAKPTKHNPIQLIRRLELEPAERTFVPQLEALTKRDHWPSEPQMNATYSHLQPKSEGQFERLPPLPSSKFRFGKGELRPPANQSMAFDLRAPPQLAARRCRPGSAFFSLLTSPSVCVPIIREPSSLCSPMDSSLSGANCWPGVAVVAPPPPPPPPQVAAVCIVPPLALACHAEIERR